MNVHALLRVVESPEFVSDPDFVARERMAQVAQQLQDLGFEVLKVGPTHIEVVTPLANFRSLIGIASPGARGLSSALPRVTQALQGLVDYVEAKRAGTSFELA